MLRRLRLWLLRRRGIDIAELVERKPVSRLRCLLFHRSQHVMEPFFMPVKPFGGWRRVCQICKPDREGRSPYKGPSELVDGKWRPLNRAS